MKLSCNQEKCLVKGILLASGFSGEEAGIIADVITHSDFTGVYSHGLSRLTRYMRQIDAGSLNPKPEFRKVLDDGAVLVFDGDNGSGIVSLNRAYEEAVEKAKMFGIGFATCRGSANIGCGSYYGWRAAKDGMVCLAGCNTYAFTSPYGGADRLIGTNPIIFAAPADEEYPIVMDISTTNVAMGKIQAFEREGKEIPKEWAKDYEGAETTDPSKAFSLSPIAGHKGYGLAVMVDILSTFLSGAKYGTDIGLFSKLETENTGSFILLIDPSKFMPLEDFRKNTDRYIRMMKESRKAPGVDEIKVPGEIEFKLCEKNLETGVEFSHALEKELTELAVLLGAAEEGTDFESLVRKFEDQLK